LLEDIGRFASIMAGKQVSWLRETLKQQFRQLLPHNFSVTPAVRALSLRGAVVNAIDVAALTATFQASLPILLLASGRSTYLVLLDDIQ